MRAPSSPPSPVVLYVDPLWISPYVFTCVVALEEKGVSFEAKPVSMKREDLCAEDYLQKSITGRVPSMLHGNFSLAESSAIAEYLDEVYPWPSYAALFPRDPHERARARQIMAWLRSDLMPLREERSTQTMFYQPAQKPLSEAAEKSKDRLLRVASQLLSDGRENIAGEWSIADSDLAFALHRLIKNGDALPGALKAYAENQWQRPSVQRFVSHARGEYFPYAY